MLTVCNFSTAANENFGLENGLTLITYSYKNLYSSGFSTSTTETVEEKQNDGQKNKIGFIGDVEYMTQVGNEIYYSLREDEGVIHKVKVMMK